MKLGALPTKTQPQDSGLCGLWRWAPKWLQKLNNMPVFIVSYVALAVIYGMSHSYNSSMIPSIEKRFGFTSQSSGIILAMNDVGHVLVALFTAHFGGHGHRPRWMSLGCIMLGLSLILMASPEIFFPMRTAHAIVSNPIAGRTDLLCSEARGLVMNDSITTIRDNCGKPENPIGPLIIFGTAQFLLGIGSTTLLILGLPFIDDNSDRKSAPIFFAISFSGRIFGPVLGYLFGALINTVYLDWSDPGFPQTDPRWISAWYLGFLCIGVGLCVFALPMGCFPRAIRQRTKDTNDSKAGQDLKSIVKGKTDAAAEKVSLQDLPRNLKRLLTNGAFMARAFSSVMEGLIIAGYMSFLPKFIGQQFQISPSDSSLAGGVPSVLAVALGVIIGGFLIRKFSPEPRHIGLGLAISAAIMSSILFGVIGLGCERTTIYGFGSAEQTLAERTQLSVGHTTCPSAQTCGCPDSNFQPVCNRATGTNYYSACHAGCHSVLRINQTTTHYRECSCVQDSRTSVTEGGELKQTTDDSVISSSLTSGLCPKLCPNLYVFVAILFVGLFFVGLPLSGGVVILYRVVGPDLKSLATGLSALLMSGLGLLPAPIMTGAIVDSTCLLWQIKDCGEQGFCLLYDTDALRWKLHLAVGTFSCITALLNCLVTYEVWNLKFEREEPGILAPGQSPPDSPLPDLSDLKTFRSSSIVSFNLANRRQSRPLSDAQNYASSNI